jgi:hypothetical protein
MERVLRFFYGENATGTRLTLKHEEQRKRVQHAIRHGRLTKLLRDAPLLEK